MDLSSLTSLLTLKLNINQLSGYMPRELGDLVSLQFLQLPGIQLDGGIPPDLGDLASLSHLLLPGNLLTLSIPVTFTNLSLSNCRFDDTNLCEPLGPVFQAWLETVSNPASPDVPCKTDGYIAQPPLDLYQDPTDGATSFKVDITRVFDTDTGDDLNVGLETFHAGLTYLDATDNPTVPAGNRCIELLGPPWAMDFPINNSTVNSTAGSATFEGSDLNGVSWPAESGYISTRLNGSANQSCRLDLDLTLTAATSGGAINVPPILDRRLQRGDAQADGNVTLGDASFIARYLAGLTDACTTVLTNSCLHSVNAASVRRDQGFDQKTSDDALFVAPYLVGMRDEFYNVRP